VVLGLTGFLVIGLTASNVVASSHAADRTQAINANALKPTECAALNLTRIVVGITGTGQSELILGSSAGETINGNGGADCILGGGGNDNLRGGSGGDVCIGGPGNDTFNSCSFSYQ
jgi:Ca2+-binding RTX toxin-like protein